MRNKTKRFRKICLASGIIFAQVSALGTFSTTAYAITDNQVSDFVIKANKDQVKEGENITLAIKEVHSQGQEIEVVIPDGLHFDEKETAKLNEKNDAIETIRMIEQSVVQIKRTSESANLGELFVVVKGEKAGQYTITAKMKEENKEVETKTSILTVSKNVKENKEQSVQKSEGNESKKAKEPLQLEKQEEKVTTVEEKKEETEKIKQVEPKEKKQKSTMQSNQALYAAPTTGRIQQLDYFKNGATNVIPLEDIFMMRITSETKVIDSKGYFKNNTLKVDPQNPTGSVLIENVGYYKGKKVILKVDVTNKGKGWSEVFMGSLMMNLGPGGAMDVEYSFLDEEGNPLPIKTSLAYRGFNRDKVIGIYNFEQKIKNIYTRQDASINYEIRPSGTYLFTSEAGGWRDEKDEVNFTTKETTSFKLYLENRISDTNSVEYLQEYRARIEIPKIEEKNQIFTSANDTGLSATFIQEIPFIADSTRYINNLSYVVNADIGNQYAKSKWIVTDLQNKDWTNGFTFKDNSDGTTTITAKPETLKNGDFYDKVYLFKEVYDFVGSESEPVDKSRLTPENQYPIHFEVSQSFDKYINYEKVSGTTLINYMGQVQVQHIDKETNQPIPNVQDTVVEGIITDPFRVDPIEIPGYQVVKDEPITGRFLPEKQTVAHIYAPIKANLEANDFSTVIGSIPTNPEELKTFILKEAKAEATELPSNTDITSQVEVDNGGLCNQIGSYTVTLRVKNVKKTITVNVIGGNLEFIEVPKTIAFENITIPSREKTVNRSNVQGEIVVSDKRENRKEWSVYVKQAKPLTSNEKDILPDALVYTQNGVDTVLNDQNYLVHSQKSSDYQNVHINWKDSEGIRLKVKPGPNVKVNETYQGELEWTLTDTPL